MSLSREESTKLGYKANIEWYKERIAALSSGFVNPVAAIKDPDPEEYRSKLDDLYKKADKLDKRIDDESTGLKIPISKDKDPEIYNIVKTMDPQSGGEYVSYELYKDLAGSVETSKSSLDLDDIIDNSSNDIFSNSQLIQDRLYSGYAAAAGQSAPKDNSAERYINRYLNNIVSWNEHDYQIRQILNFADNYLGTFPDPAYVSWGFKQDTLFEKTQIKGYKDLWNNFSEIGKSEVTRLDGAFKGLVSLRPDNSVASLTDRYIDYTNKFLNGLNDLFNESWAADLICCFMKYTTRLDLKTLKGIRALLQLLKTGLNFDFQDILNSFKDIFNNIMRGLLLNQLMGLINQIIQRLVDPIKRWINNPDDPNWQKVFECTPIRQLIERYITDAIDYIQKFFQDLLNEIYKDLEMQHIYKDAKLAQAKENKWIARALKIIDMIIGALELSAQCGIQGSPNEEEVQKVMDNYNINQGTTYIYIVEDKPNIYNSFITAEQQKAIEEGRATISDFTAKTSTVTNETQKEARGGRKVDDCLKNIKDTDMPQAVAWLNEITSNSQEKA